MNSQNTKLSILIVGAFGGIGSLLTKHCLTKPNLLVNILVRDPNKNKELVEEVAKAGGKVFQGDVTEPATFRGISRGIHTVVFTLPPFNADVNVKGQIAMIDDCAANGVKRIVPSGFSWNYSKFSREELADFEPVKDKQKVIDHLKNLPIKTLVIDIGIVLDILFKFTLGKDFQYWGDPDQKYQSTSYDDIAQFTACAVTREDLDGHIVIAAHDLSVNELAAIKSNIRGTTIIPKRLGSLEDLKMRTEELERQGGGLPALVSKLRTFFFTEKSRFDKVNTDDFPEFKVASVEELLRQKPDI